MVELAEITKSAWEQGYDALAHDGLPLTANPYSAAEQMEKHAGWSMGWGAAFAEL